MIALLLAATLACSSPQTQIEMTTCAGQDAERAEAREQRAYHATLARFPHDATLPQSEQLWRAMLDPLCDFMGDAALGGTMQPMLVSECYADAADRRVATLALATGSPNPAALRVTPAVQREHDRIYGLLDVRIDPPQRAALVASEHAWNIYRARACANARIGCADTLTRDRINAYKGAWLAEPFW